MTTLETHPTTDRHENCEDIPTLCCPVCRADADLPAPSHDIPLNQYYFCPTCPCEWCFPGPVDQRSARLFVLGALTWVLFQCALMLSLILGWTLVLRDNYSYTHDAAVGYGFLYGGLTWIGSTFLTFPAMWASEHVARRVRGYVWGESLR